VTNGGDAAWRSANRAHWDERTAIHLAPGGYNFAPLREGRAQLTAIERHELPPLTNKRAVHLQCHFGADTLKLLQHGAAAMVGLDFSGPAIIAARALAAELGFADRARFVEADLYDAVAAISDAGTFDLAYITWGAICWLPDIRRWCGIVAQMLRPGGSLYLADGHPAALVLDDAVAAPDGMPGFYAPYFGGDPVTSCEYEDYIVGETTFENATTHTWIHPLGEIVTGLIEAGMQLDWLHEHDAVPWRMFRVLARDAQGLYHWPDKSWLPLAFSLSATRL
jgi:SAM-dependent methyltransferase